MVQPLRSSWDYHLQVKGILSHLAIKTILVIYRLMGCLREKKIQILIRKGRARDGDGPVVSSEDSTTAGDEERSHKASLTAWTVLIIDAAIDFQPSYCRPVPKHGLCGSYRRDADELLAPESG